MSVDLEPGELDWRRGEEEPGWRRILAAEHGDSRRRLVDRLLAGLGIVRGTAGSDERRAGDLEVTDLRLPGPSGTDLLLKLNSPAGRTRLVLMSGDADESAAAAAIDRARGLGAHEDTRRSDRESGVTDTVPVGIP